MSNETPNDVICYVQARIDCENDQTATEAAEAVAYVYLTRWQLFGVLWRKIPKPDAWHYVLACAVFNLLIAVACGWDLACTGRLSHTRTLTLVLMVSIENTAWLIILFRSQR